MPRGGVRPQATCHPNKPHAGRGLCRNCLETLYRRRRGVQVGGKKQAVCHPDKPNYGHGQCFECYRHLHQCERAVHSRAKKLRSYGVTPEDYARLILEQGGTCAICRQPETRVVLGKLSSLAVDHCHDTGKVRGLLCHRCNVAIGLLKNDRQLLYRAMDYLWHAHVDQEELYAECRTSVYA